MLTYSINILDCFSLQLLWEEMLNKG